MLIVRFSIEKDDLELPRQYFDYDRGIPEEGSPIWIKENSTPIIASDLRKWGQADELEKQLEKRQKIKILLNKIDRYGLYGVLGGLF